MQKICSKCGKANAHTTKECVACHTPMTIRFNTKFIVGTEQMTFEGLFEEVHALKNRISVIENRHDSLQKDFDVKFSNMVKEELKKQSKKQQEAVAVKKVVAEKRVTDHPDTIAELEKVFREIQQKYAQAQQAKNYQLMADLAYEGKKVRRRITRLQEAEKAKDTTKEEKVKTENVKDIQKEEPKDEAPKKEPQKEAEKKETSKKEVKHDENWATIATLEQELAQIWRARRKALQKGMLEKAAQLFEAEKAIEERLMGLKNSGEEKEENNNDAYDPKHYKKEEEKEEEEKTVEGEKAEAQEKEEPQKEEKEEANKEEPKEKETPKLDDRIEKAKAEYQRKVAQQQKQQKKVKPKKVKPKRTGPSVMEQFFAPIVSGYKYVVGKYEQFKKENKLPLFFLTLAGIAALLFGFGFLVQYSAVTYFGTFSTQVKVGFGFLSSFTTMGIGIYLIRKNKKFREFGSALIGLGLALNYLFIYFLAPVISSTAGFAIILLNTIMAVVLALKYEAKIIAILSLVGGALSPLYLQSSGENTIIYFAYLWILSASSIF
ncbi:MAG: DUF2339 domain-containing protein, partial [Aureispira sp.]|nr:DUF2339 domain-containing protein [Aureispira sp.]